VVLYRPHHRQLDHPFLRNAEISAACEARSAWGCHVASFADLLRMVAVAQRQRYPDKVVSWPPETASQSISQVAYGFSLLVLRHADLGMLVPELAGLPALAYPVRAFPGGKIDQILIVDGFQGEASGLLAATPCLTIRLDGTLSGAEDAAWNLFGQLRVILDASLRIRDLRGSLRAGHDELGWTGIEGFRKAAGSFRGRTLADDQAGEDR
jgi:hypothetical protein